MQSSNYKLFMFSALCASAPGVNTVRRFVIAGGGTGGHLFPGITIARECMLKNPGNNALFISTGNPFERSALSRAGFPLERITVEGIKGRGLWKKLKSFTLLPLAVFQALRILRSFRPDLVVGVGSYAAGPVVLAAWLMKITIVLHEQNILPGITNRTLARFASRIYVSFENTAGSFDLKKVRVTGNPVRHEILHKTDVSFNGDAGAVGNDPSLNVLIIGGSQGAHHINMTMIDTLKHVKEKGHIRIVHQTGSADEAHVKSAYERHEFQSTVKAFFNDMDSRYHEADLIICRAGATTVAEVTAIGKGVIFIPFPYAADNHQVLNARALVEEGAAEIIEEKDLTAENLAKRINWYAANREALSQMAQKAKRFGKPAAARDIVDDMYELING